MNKRFARLLLLALSLLLLPRTAPAQISSRNAKPTKQSHLDLPDGLDLDNPQEMLARRLEQFRQVSQLQNQVQELLKDRNVLDRIQNLPEAELQRLKDKVFKDPNDYGTGLQSASGPRLGPQQIEAFRRFADWLEREGHNLPNPELIGIEMSKQTGPVTPLPSSDAPTDPPTPPTMPATPSFFDRMEADTANWVMENLDEFGSDALQALARAGPNEEVGPFADLLRAVRQHDLTGFNPGEPAMELSRRFSNVGNFLQRHAGSLGEARSLFRGVSMPHPSSPSASMPSAVAADGDTWATALITFLMLGVIVLFLCKGSLGSSARVGAEEPWRLGPWPVPPGSVSTRRDVIRAFEYLALLCLGPAASACHHHELAERLAQQDSGDAARRQAAETLAWLYEQSRYAPTDEPLSPGQLTDARHALCFLAGVTAV